MSVKQKYALSGQATVPEIVAAWLCECEGNTDIIHDIRTLSESMYGLCQSEAGRRVVLSMLCGVVNEQFYKTGSLCSVDNSGRFREKYHSDDATRQILCDTLGLPQHFEAS